MTEYEHRFCAFIDLLGSRELIKRTASEPTLLRDLVSAFTAVLEARPLVDNPQMSTLFLKMVEANREKLPSGYEGIADAVKNKGERGSAFAGRAFAGGRRCRGELHQWRNGEHYAGGQGRA